MVYNDDEVKRCFDLRIWVYVSPDFKVKRIIKAAIETATGSKCDLEELDALQLKLWDILHKRKFLLVLDDVWNEDEDEWDKLRPLFSYGFDGSRILVTTRSQKMAMIIGPSNRAYHLKGLCEEDCWALFRKRAFLDQLEEENHPNLVVVGKISQEMPRFTLICKSSWRPHALQERGDRLAARAKQ
ncbi:putative disease resistance protein RGA3 [Sesamum angolense]|uniref:Disease resistance protein RGA3 n=1 Tax=Sesamum angolense TaxID=2727404 RepID=A0AAE1T435_9LAMI|nr:putative disease resistance protein RGA3 [Sesamum angolense]